jgi:hypothetical protein
LLIINTSTELSIHLLLFEGLHKEKWERAVKRVTRDEDRERDDAENGK